MPRPPNDLPNDYSKRIKELRGRLGLSQERFAEQLGVSFATINRWENGQSRPSKMAWRQILNMEGSGGIEIGEEVIDHPPQSISNIRLDFTSRPEVVKAIAESQRLSYGHMFNPSFATEVSLIDPLPHQRMAVYNHMLIKPRLRFMLADDAGAGKTIMTGLYIREMLSRRLLSRVLIVPPAGLVGNWKREMETLFNMNFKIIRGAEARVGNPFVGDESNLVIVSIDTLAGAATFSRLKEKDVLPYDLVVFDEAHKLTADKEPDLTIRKTDRYRVAEALAGVPGIESLWTLPWTATHILLLTATPHMGKDYPYYCLWRLLEPYELLTKEAFDTYPDESKSAHFIRRTKEEMVRFDGTKIYPMRISDTMAFNLSQGEISEQKLYDETTAYMRTFYNMARMLNRSAVRLAMSVFQRRLASSTYALKCSYERRLAKLDCMIEGLSRGEITEEKLKVIQTRLKVRDGFEDMTGDEEQGQEGEEENEETEGDALGVMINFNLKQLELERAQVERLLNLATDVLAIGQESKFEKLREFLTDIRYKDEKVIIFTEHRDTLTYLVRRLEAMGLTGKVASIHGGMDFIEREEQITFFKKSTSEGGAQYLIATDAAGEGINLQFCWLMVNYDIPWNPARLEQRMGRIHRYGQKRDPVIIVNLVASGTREGKVLTTLLEKLERIRQELGSDKVFDVVGRMFEGVSIRDYMEKALDDEPSALGELEGKLTKEQIAAMEAREKKLFGEGGEVAKELPKEREKLANEDYCHLLPAYVRSFLENALPLLDLGIDGELNGTFSIHAMKPRALDSLNPVLELYPAEEREKLTVTKPMNGSRGVFLRPGEPFFDRICDLLENRYSIDAQKGAIFIDPMVQSPYLFHLADVKIVRNADPGYPSLTQSKVIEDRLIGLKQDADGSFSEVPVEHLLLLRGCQGFTSNALDLMAKGEEMTKKVEPYLQSTLISKMVQQHQTRLASELSSRLEFLRRGYDLQDAELARRRSELGKKKDDPKAMEELEKVKERQRVLATQRDKAIFSLNREVELVAPGAMRFIAHALVLPSSDPEDKDRYDANVEHIAMNVARASEEAEGAVVFDVHTPELALAVGLPKNPGFDLWSHRKDGTKRSIEVKGRDGKGSVEITENEWSQAANMRERFWLYAVFDCATPYPRAIKVQDPAFRLSFKAKGSVLVDESEILRASVDVNYLRSMK